MAASSASSSISVTVRVRPFTIREAAQLSKCDDTPLFLGDGSLAGVPTPKLAQRGIRSVVKVVDDKCLIFDPPEDNPVQKFTRSVVPNGKRVKDQTFGFDRIFDENTTQAEVYESTSRNLLDSVLDGYNATVFAYGATGCGKTHTITGTAQQPGIIFLTMQELFEKIEERKEEKVTEVSLSYLEIYNETIRDLLVEGDRKGLMLREDANQAVSVAGLSSHHPQNVQEVMDIIMRGNEMRTMSPTEANATSSRSHAVLQINVAQKDRNADVNEPLTMATLSIIDLAGSERASATRNRGERLQEGANINKSLLALGSCINALCDPRKRNHIPYRNSKLTRLLKFSLGGNCKTVMIVCVSPSSQHYDETQNTLRYANRAKNIQTKVTRNVYNVNRHVKDFLVKIDEQMALINELKAQQKDYESIAFTKFRKQNEKKDTVAKENVARLRSSYENAAVERQEKVSSMLKLRQVSRRIGMLSSWIAAFDNVCDSCENVAPMANLQAIRKTAQGILFELENTRHHFNQKISRNNWDRAINTALEHGIQQLREFETSDSTDVANLTREAELLKANADREMLSTIAEQEKAGDAATVQMLLQAHFETISAIENIMHLTEAEAIEVGKKILNNMLNSCTSSVANVVKPDGNAASIDIPPTPKADTSVRRRKSSLAGIPFKSLKPATAIPSHVAASPTKNSPRRRKTVMAKKGISFTPKRTPIKASKRGVRWKDDVQDGSLAEYEKTPRKSQVIIEEPLEEPLEEPSEELPPPRISPMPRGIPVFTKNDDSPRSSSPIPASPEPSLGVPSKNNRFKAGFLAKKSGSPVPQTAPSLVPEEHSPLRSIENSSFLNRPSLDRPSRIAIRSPSGSYRGSPASDDEKTWKADKEDAIKINAAMRRISGGQFGNGPSAVPVSKIQRRRSPTATSISSSPPESSISMFSASEARRMVKSDKSHDAKPNILGPRVISVTKNSRRTTMGGDFRPREVSLTGHAVRLSMAASASSESRFSLGPAVRGALR
ncbi:kinesin family protein [Talaromyces proteolyticus]|uniref:Kinesin family protein n=1 Tax=Talaromyces proteolyticus TaxID=1131652 RepID=A0AAD4KSY0_9EURO|nr:kinesin family protein [Talaromyces proteolyticus]KAH8700333.1 kinesin family protein [Talaromyces proteolyticus]